MTLLQSSALPTGSSFIKRNPQIGEGNGNPLQCSCLENPRDGGAWWADVYGVTQSRTQLKRLSSSSRLSTKPGIFVVGHHFRGGSKARQGELPIGSVAKSPPVTRETQEMPVRSLRWENPLEEEMATHSSILAWRVPWTEEPGGLQCIGSHKIRNQETA